MNITERIKLHFGSLKHYARVRKINYQHLRNQISTNTFTKPTLQLLINDGILKESEL